MWLSLDASGVLVTCVAFGSFSSRLLPECSVPEGFYAVGAVARVPEVLGLIVVWFWIRLLVFFPLVRSLHISVSNAGGSEGGVRFVGVLVGSWASPDRTTS